MPNPTVTQEDPTAALPAHLRELDELRTGEVAEALGVRSINTIKNWIRAGYIRRHRVTPSGQHLVPMAEVLRLLKLEMRLASTPPGDEPSAEELAALSG